MLPALLFPAGCSEESYGPPSGARTPAAPESPVAAERPAPSKSSDPVLMVGNLTMPMPAPDGLRRLPGEHPLMRAAQSRLAPGEVLLCVFERAGDAQAGQPGDMSPETLLRRELWQVGTLSKWLNAEVSSLDFLKIKQPWQDESIEFNQSALNNFEEAVRDRLAAEREFNYNLGMIDSSPLHISFLRVEKHTAPAGEVIYTCATTSLVWRHGKILRLGYSKPVENFGQIHGVVAESVGYVQKLQALDRSTRLPGIPNSASPAARNSVQESLTGPARSPF